MLWSGFFAFMPVKKKPGITARQERFCQEYLIDLHAGNAAKRAGYSARTCEVLGYQLLQKPLVKARIDALIDKRTSRVEITADYVLKTIEETIERCKEEKFDPTNILKGCDLLGKHLGMFKEIRDNRHSTVGEDGKLAPIKINVSYVAPDK
jgi:phage terminase small subunit